ncbi:holotricin-3-like [Stegodyphus dumicola]|uniref:holotricin-3-like n=1 Tax=Stegodyphus dumicola TaxID=202533 RepID=UPI0015B1F729|nr:holotricin-3-like [Stegodyphus dumicola]
MKALLCTLSAFLVLTVVAAIDPWHGGYEHEEPKVIKVVKPVHHVVKVVKHLPPPIPVISHVQLHRKTIVGQPLVFHHSEFIPVHHGHGHGYGGHGYGGHGHGHHVPIYNFYGGHHGGLHGGHHGGLHIGGHLGGLRIGGHGSLGFH